MTDFVIKPITDNHRDWIKNLLTEHWGSTESVSRGRLHHADRLPGFIAQIDGRPRGLITYHIEGNNCEIATLNSLDEKRGIGRALIEAVRNAAISEGCQRLWLITTNDNTNAFKFYQKLGFVVAAYHKDAMVKSREIKPGIPLLGMAGIPIKDEIEFEQMLPDRRTRPGPQ